MEKPVLKKERIQSLGEEIANSVSHGIGFIAAVIISTIIIISAVKNSSASGVVGASVFSFTLIMLYIVSTLYHSLAMNKAKRVFRILDHIFIFMMIAGTYTPFTLSVLKGSLGWTLFGLIWGMAFAGIIFQCLGGLKKSKLTVFLYLAMGWLIIFAVKPMLGNMPVGGFFWLLIGGFAYTVGVGFYAAKKMKYAHFVWHLLVIAGSACHSIAVLRYAV
ncbi:MAG: hemolysin III family protein [Deltaproteobacteria bacterium]|nr:hemolysin III family protein [Deltaproteobacteria bacterium]